MRDPLDVGVALKLAWSTFTREASALVLGFVLAAVVSVVTCGVCLGPMVVGYNRLCLQAARGEAIKPEEVMEGFQHFGAAFVLTLVIALGVGIGTQLCFAPGI